MIPQKNYGLMVLASLTLAICLVSGPSLLFAQEQAAQPLLHLKNGDQLPGQLSLSDGSVLSWKSDLFLDTLRFQPAAVHSLVFRPSKFESRSNEPFAFWLSNGDSIHGKLVGISDNSVSVESDRYGKLQLVRSSIKEVINLEKQNSFLDDFPDASKWRGNRQQDWYVDESNALCSERAGTALARQLQLSSVVSIELEIAWKDKLDFMFGFGFPEKKWAIDSMTRIETWDDTIALVNGDGDAEMVYESMSSRRKQLKFVITWDLENKTVLVLDDNGKELASIENATIPQGAHPGVRIANKDGDLKVLGLRIDSRGKKYNPSKQGIYTDTGMVEGTVKSFDGQELVIEVDGEEKNVAMQTIEAITMTESGTTPDADDTLLQHVEVNFVDGTSLKGRIVSIDDQNLTLETSYSENPIECNLAAVHSLFFVFPTVKHPEAIHTARLQNRVIHGRLLPARDLNQKELCWQFPGSEAVRINFSDAIVSSSEKRDIKPLAVSTDRVYLINRDSIACKVTNIDDKFVHIQSPFEETELPLSEVRGIDFSVKKASGEWKVEGGTEKIKNGIHFTKSHEIARHIHDLREGKVVEFDLTWTGDCTGSLNFFPCVADDEMPSLPVFSFGIWDGQFGIYRYTPEMEPIYQFPDVDPRHARFSIRILDDKYQIAVNGVEVAGLSVTNSCKGDNLLIQSASPYKFSISIQNFLQRASNGVASQSRITGIAHALTIPRFKQKNPPKNVICSTKGDFLRGNIGRFDGEHFWFESKVEEFKIHRSKVAALVWMDLSKLDAEQSTARNGKNSPSNKVEDKIQLVTHQNERITLVIDGWKGLDMVGQSTLLGKVNIQIDAIKEFRFGRFAYEAPDVKFANWVAVPSKEVELEGACATDSPASTESVDTSIGKEVEDFELTMLDGTKQSLGSLQNKVVVLDFWATWCGPCVRSLPGIEKTVQDFGSDDVVFVAVNLKESPELIREFFEARNWKTPAALDLDGNIAQAFGVTSIPHTVVIDRRGKIAFTHTGSSSGLTKKLTNVIESSLELNSTNEQENE